MDLHRHNDGLNSTFHAMMTAPRTSAKLTGTTDATCSTVSLASMLTMLTTSIHHFDFLCYNMNKENIFFLYDVHVFKFQS